MVEERPDGTPVINQPAGHLEYGATLTEAGEREVLDETGCRCAPAGSDGVSPGQGRGTRQPMLRG